jgi:hypothetical protein
MKPFAAKLKDGSHLLGLAVHQSQVGELLEGAKLTIDLESAGVGLWFKEADGSRTFIQPRESKVVLLIADSKEDIGTFLGVKLP